MARRLVASLVGLVLFLACWTGPAHADDAPVGLAARVNGVTFPDRVQLFPDRPARVEVSVDNRGSTPLRIRSVRLTGSALGLTFFVYDTSVALEVPAGKRSTWRVDVDVSDLGAQATGLLPLQVSVLGDKRKVLASASATADVRGSLASTYGLFGLGLLVATGLLWASALLALARRRLPANRWRRAVRFAPGGVGLGLVAVVSLSVLRTTAPSAHSEVGFVGAAATIAFVLGYLTPAPPRQSRGTTSAIKMGAPSAPAAPLPAGPGPLPAARPAPVPATPVPTPVPMHVPAAERTAATLHPDPSPYAPPAGEEPGWDGRGWDGARPYAADADAYAYETQTAAADYPPSEYLPPDSPDSGYPTPDYSTPGSPGFGHPTPGPPSSGYPAADYAVPDHAVPDLAAPGQAAPDTVVPGIDRYAAGAYTHDPYSDGYDDRYTDRRGDDPYASGPLAADSCAGGQGTGPGSMAEATVHIPPPGPWVDNPLPPPPPDPPLSPSPNTGADPDPPYLDGGTDDRAVPNPAPGREITTPLGSPPGEVAWKDRR